MKPSEKKKLNKKGAGALRRGAVPEVDVKAIFAKYAAEARKRRMRKLIAYAIAGALSVGAIFALLALM